MIISLTADRAPSVAGGVKWGGERGHLAVDGNLGGGTVTLKFSSDDGTTWKTLLTYDAASPELAGFELGAGNYLDVEFSGSTTPDAQVRISVVRT